MKPLSRVLCAVDASFPARSAFRYALAVAHAHSAGLTVIKAVPKSESFRWHARRRGASTMAMQQAADAVGVAFDMRVQQGTVDGVITLHAAALQPDLVVIGTHARVGLDRLRRGSIAERVVRGAGRAVLVVPSLPAGDEPDLGVFRRVLCAVDLGEASPDVLRSAGNLTDRNGRITLLHVITGAMRHLGGRYFFSVPEYDSYRVQDARRELERLTNEETSGRVTTRIVRGSPVRAMLEAATHMRADLIVTGASASRFPLLRPTTATRVAREAATPVLVVPPQASPRMRIERRAA